MLIGEIELLPLNDGFCRLPPEFYVGLDWSTHQDMLTNATVRFGRGDLDHFAGDEDVAAILDSAAGRVELIDGDNVALAPGLTARHTPGHTPGHYGLVVSSGAERAVLLGDAVECPLQLDEPDFSAMSDVDPELARRTREALWRELEGTDALVGAAHFPGLEFGRVLRGTGTRWFPVP